MDEAIKFADESPFPDPAELYDHVYVSYPLDQMKRGAHMND
jgi:TPP-dependent pyruvate/acetoin dehydrogenase alpha subunit